MTLKQTAWVKKTFIVFMTWLMAACVATTPKLTYLDRAERAVSEKKWVVAYRFLEDGFVANNQEIKNKAFAIFRANPEIRAAALETFSRETLYNTFKMHGMVAAKNIEQKRLMYFSAVATTSELDLAKSNLKLAEDDFSSYQAKEDEAKRLAEEEKQRIARDRAEARAKAIFRCADKLECDKAFSLTQIFIVENSDMKIQFATDTIIQTYNPTDKLKVGLSAVKTPKIGASAEISIAVNCKAENEREFEVCQLRSNLIYKSFPRFLKEKLVD